MDRHFRISVEFPNGISNVYEVIYSEGQRCPMVDVMRKELEYLEYCAGVLTQTIHHEVLEKKALEEDYEAS